MPIINALGHTEILFCGNHRSGEEANSAHCKDNKDSKMKDSTKGKRHRVPTGDGRRPGVDTAEGLE